MTQATVLKVPTLEYLPYTFFNILSPLMSVFIAAIGYKIFRITFFNILSPLMSVFIAAIGYKIFRIHPEKQGDGGSKG